MYTNNCTGGFQGGATDTAVEYFCRGNITLFQKVLSKHLGKLLETVPLLNRQIINSALNQLPDADGGQSCALQTT